MNDKDAAALQAELEALRKQNADLQARRTGEKKPQKENYTFVTNGVLGEKQIEIPVSVKALKFLPSSTGKSMVSTIRVQFPGGVSGQLVLTTKA